MPAGQVVVRPLPKRARRAHLYIPGLACDLDNPEWTPPAPDEPRGLLQTLRRPAQHLVYKQRAIARVWLAAGYDGYFPAARHGIGTMPDWLAFEVDAAGWEHVADLPNLSCWDGYADFIRWAMALGIAPMQPFLVEIHPPRGVESHGPDGTDYDIEYDAEVVAIAPLPDEVAARRWAEWITHMREVRQEKLDRERAHEAAIARAWHQPQHMYIAQRYSCNWSSMGPYGPDNSRGYTLYHAAPGDGASQPIALATVHHERTSREEASWPIAMDTLVTKVCLAHPHLTPAVIRGLPVRRA